MITTSTTKKLFMGFGALALVAVILGLPADAFATSTDVKMQAKALADQAAVIPRLIAVGAYVIGAFFAVRALFALKGFIEDADDTPITKVLGFGAISALLIMLPYIIDVMTNSIGSGAVSQQQSSAQKFSDQTW